MIRVVSFANLPTPRPPIPEITPLTVQLSLIVTPPAARARDKFTIEQRMARLDEALQELRMLTLSWSAQREPGEGFVDFEARQIEAIRQLARASTELTLALAEARHRLEMPARFEAGGTTVYRLTPPEPRSLNTWFGTVRYSRSYARPVEGGAGWFPLDAEPWVVDVTGDLTPGETTTITYEGLYQGKDYPLTDEETAASIWMTSYLVISW